jgi:5-methylcytosine-specific restriction protein A
VKVPDRLSAEILAGVTPGHLRKAAQMLSEGRVSHCFGPSTDFDVVVAGGVRLPPKAVFGVAATEALGFAVTPGHIRGGARTTTFRLLKAAGFKIVPKAWHGDSEAPADAEWVEGTPIQRVHLERERARGLADRKKASFSKKHGRLFCELCGLDPVQAYGHAFGEAAIEVHHNAVQVSQMPEGHKTRLADLQCVCANCHRFVHRQMRHRDLPKEDSDIA